MIKMKKIKTICFFSMLMFSSLMFGTGQTPEMLIFKGDTLNLFSLPLRQYPDTSQINPRRMFKGDGCLNTSNWRRYIAIWTIENDRLYLLNIRNNCSGSKISHQDVEIADLKDIFHDRYKNGMVLADWFSGSLYCPIGKQEFVVGDGFLTSYEQELELNIQNGVLLGEKLLDNSKSRQLNYDTLFQNGVRNHFDSLINWEIIPKISGGDIRVNVKFSANEDGIIDDVQVMRPRGDVFDSEAIRVVRTLPANVQIYHGKLRRVIWVMPVIFSESSRKK